VWIDGSKTGNVVYTLDNVICAAPCLSTTLDVGGCAGYTLNSGRNCYAGHGATDIDGSTALGIMALAECQAACDSTDGCDGVVTSFGNNANGHVNCYRKSNVDLGSCDDGAWAFDFYLKN
jgi:hypothetical protein